MRTAPAVRVVCAAGSGWPLLQMALYALAAAAFATWCAQRAGLSTNGVALTAVVAATAGATLAKPWLKSGHLTLNWSGAAWTVDLGDVAGALELERVDVMLDLGAVLLLRAKVADASHRRALWLPLLERDAGADFPLLCAALYASQPH